MSPIPPRVARNNSGWLFFGDLQDAAIGDAHAQRAHMLAETAFLVVVLAVNVGRDHPAQGNVLRAGSDRGGPSARPEQLG